MAKSSEGIQQVSLRFDKNVIRGSLDALLMLATVDALG